MAKETIYVAGHKSPDLDSVVGTIAYAYLKQALDSEHKYIPVRAGEPNLETKYVLEKYDIPMPELLESLTGQKVILVDHNEEYQVIDGIEDATILEVIDHHKLNFAYSDPIKIIIEPIGSSSNVIAKMFKADGIEIPKNLASAMLGATMVDTVITKSPTCTPEDLDIIEELAATADIKDWKKYGMEIFRVRSSVSKLTNEEIVVSDYKDFDINGKKFGIGQVETVDISEFDDRRSGLLEALEQKKKDGEYHSVVLFLTDIIKEESHFLVASDDAESIAKAFGKKLDKSMFTAPVISRKKQVVPTLLKNL